MAETTLLRNAERSGSEQTLEHKPLERKVLSTLGTLRLAPAPARHSQRPDCGITAAPSIHAPDHPAPHREARADPSVWKPSGHGYISPRWYDLSFAVLILASAAVALYRLVWMGQP